MKKKKNPDKTPISLEINKEALDQITDMVQALPEIKKELFGMLPHDPDCLFCKEDDQLNQEKDNMATKKKTTKKATKKTTKKTSKKASKKATSKTSNKMTDNEIQNILVNKNSITR